MLVVRRSFATDLILMAIDGATYEVISPTMPARRRKRRLFGDLLGKCCLPLLWGIEILDPDERPKSFNRNVRVRGAPLSCGILIGNRRTAVNEAAPNVENFAPLAVLHCQ